MGGSSHVVGPQREKVTLPGGSDRPPGAQQPPCTSWVREGEHSPSAPRGGSRCALVDPPEQRGGWVGGGGTGTRFRLTEAPAGAGGGGGAASTEQLKADS